MSSIHWTGHLFVDAGLAAIAAVAKVQRLEDLTPGHLHTAAQELERVLLSDQALGVGVERAFARSALSQLFPNSELVNNSNWKGSTPEEKVAAVRKKFRESLHRDLARAIACLSQEGSASCSFCGRLVPEEAVCPMRKDKVPLLVGIVNFYPAFSWGVQACGLCAFAIRFLPLAVLGAARRDRLWLLHTQTLPVVTAIAERYGWQHFNRAISANKVLEFYRKWQTAGDAAVVLYLLCELLETLGDHLRTIYQNPLPTTAYVFSNDNQKPFVQTLPIPHEVLSFLAVLQIHSARAFQRFWKELLYLPEALEGKARKERGNFIQGVASSLLQGKGIIGTCLQHGEGEEAPALRGGWIGHRLYLREVQNMPESKLAILERLGLSIAQDADAKKRTIELRQAKSNELYGIFLRYVREGWLRHDEFYLLLPPNDYRSASELRDIVLAVIYEWQHCQERGEEFPPSATEAGVPTPDETLQCIQKVGSQLRERLPNLSRWIGQLQTARTVDRIRAVYLTAVRSGALGFSDFVFLAPLGDRQQLWLLRDYLLAFLFEQVREALPAEEEIAMSFEANET